ncbi:MAG: FapA family protein [Peptococcaceae bacterium]|nr:FapA family protein [Peptococcaceae bacterium]
MGPENRPDENIVQHGSGEVWIAGGKVYVKNPSGTGKVPTITPGQGVDLLVNGNRIMERTAVREDDEILIVPHTVEEPGSFQIRVGPGGMSATLELKMGTITRHVVQDSRPESDLVVKTVKLVEKTCPFTLAEIMQEMTRRNISFGIKHDEIQEILAKPEDGLYLIAEGIPPGDTVDERVELNFAAGPGEQKVSAESEKVNFRDMVEIPSVEPGALLAVKHFGVQGTPGRKVTGDIIPPAKPQVFELVGGKGVEISPDGSKAYASIGGRPVARKTGNRYFIDVEPVLHKKGDVDISSGNIRFKGDVVVHGNVCEGMTVQAAGKIDIRGMVFQARIAAQGDIKAGRNIMGSDIVAGGNNSFFKALHKILDSLHTDLAEIARVVPELARHPKMKDVKTGQLVQVLIDRKYGRVPGLIAEMVKLSGQNSFILPREMGQLLEKVEKNLSGLNLLKIESVEQLQSLLSEILDVQRVIDGMARDRAGITFGYAVNSRIEASGDVRVEGLGCINTTIRAGGNVNIKGVFRGGEIVAGGDVILNEAGSELGVRTLVRAGEGRKIYIKKAHGGVRIQIGDRRANITTLQLNIKAELDEDGSLSINSSPKA